MTREQALETLKEMVFTAYGHRSEALDMAISALSDYDKMQKISLDLAFENDELINKMNELSADGDCISRTEVIKAIDEREDVNGKVNAEDIRTDIVTMPSVQPKKGEWIKTKDQYETYHFTCSKCGNDIATKSDAWDDNFCSECGADMRGEK